MGRLMGQKGKTLSKWVQSILEKCLFWKTFYNKQILNTNGSTWTNDNILGYWAESVNNFVNTL